MAQEGKGLAVEEWGPGQPGSKRRSGGKRQSALYWPLGRLDENRIHCENPSAQLGDQRTGRVSARDRHTERASQPYAGCSQAFLLESHSLGVHAVYVSLKWKEKCRHCLLSRIHASLESSYGRRTTVLFKNVYILQKTMTTTTGQATFILVLLSP